MLKTLSTPLKDFWSLMYLTTTLSFMLIAIQELQKVNFTKSLNVSSAKETNMLFKGLLIKLTGVK